MIYRFAIRSLCRPSPQQRVTPVPVQLESTGLAMHLISSKNISRNALSLRNKAPLNGGLVAVSRISVSRRYVPLFISARTDKIRRTLLPCQGKHEPCSSLQKKRRASGHSFEQRVHSPPGGTFRSAALKHGGLFQVSTCTRKNHLSHNLLFPG